MRLCGATGSPGQRIIGRSALSPPGVNESMSTPGAITRGSTPSSREKAAAAAWLSTTTRSAPCTASATRRRRRRRPTR